MVTKGAMLWLACTYDLDGGTLGHLRWRDEEVRTVILAIPTSTPQCSTSFPDNYRIDCNLASNEVRLGILNPVHGDTYTCSVYLSDATLKGWVLTQVSIIVPVPNVTLTSPVSDTVTVTPGDSQVYTYVTGSCRPPARIDWYKDGVNVTNQTGSVSNDGDEFVTTSSFTLTGAKDDRPATVQCRASNVDGMTPVQSGVKTLVVQCPPEIPTNIQEMENTETTIIVQWTEGFNGGQPQTFVILYRPEGGTKTETVSVIEQQQSTYTKEITGLIPNTRYLLNMYAYNVVGNSSLSSVVDIISKTNQECSYKGEMTSIPNLASIALFITSSVLLVTAVFLVMCIICRRKLRKMRGRENNPVAEAGVNLPLSPVGQHDISTERSHYDDLNLEEREPPSNYECLGSNAAANVNTQASTDDRQMYESLGTRSNAAVYDELEGPASRAHVII
ncbi:nephrin-like [Pecten maximus]|uniref:nephrin-like n=1 Tax=Pecten maximus TaxID=6579 RepID=UPI001458FC0E|nr:nephrin-like [Pecten maximus]